MSYPSCYLKLCFFVRIPSPIPTLAKRLRLHRFWSQWFSTFQDLQELIIGGVFHEQMSLHFFLAKPSRDLREWSAIDGCWWGWNFPHSLGRVSRQLFHIHRHTKWFAAVSSFKADWKKPFALGNVWEWRHSEKLPQNRDKLSDFRIAWKLRLFFELWPWQVKLKTWANPSSKKSCSSEVGRKTAFKPKANLLITWIFLISNILNFLEHAFLEPCGHFIYMFPCVSITL